jgi:beta-phosphoglucomutase family hydrolase
MRQFQAVIFDMDGVIVDSEPHHERAFREVFQEMGYGATHGIHFPDYYGKSDRALWMDFIERHKPTQTLDQLAEWKERRFLETIRAEEPIFEDLPKLLHRLSARYKLGLASGSYHPIIDAILAMKNLRQYFAAVVSAQDVARGKPAPDIFLRAAQLLKVEPSRCCVVEDAEAGVEGALAAGMTAIGITNSLPAGKLSRANYVVSTYAEIDRLLIGAEQNENARLA